MNIKLGLTSIGASVLDGLRLLIVDDSQDSVDMMGLLLEQHGARVTTVTSGAAALESANNEDFELIISDVSMPEIDGLEMIRRLRAHSRHPRIPAVALTGLTSDEDILEIYQAGFTAHLTKPIDFEQMLQVVTKAIQLGR